jgi:FG-GAP repeat
MQCVCVCCRYDDDYYAHHDDVYAGLEHWWEDEMYHQPPNIQEGTYVWVDAHLLCTPTIADIDGDGQDELVVAASYYYDREYYDDPV